MIGWVWRSSEVMTPGDTLVMLTSPRLLAEPWRLEGRCVRAGRNESQRRLSSADSPVYSTRTNMHFDTTRSIWRSFVHSTTMSPLYRVPTVFASRDSEPARRGDRLLSHVEMCGHETLTRKKNKNKNYTRQGSGQTITQILQFLYYKKTVKQPI